MLKKENGITLVALVVTIVVLLILAGVSISLTLGENSMVKKAQEAKKAQNEATQNDLDTLDRLSDEINTELGK